jgi:hypothetical protein
LAFDATVSAVIPIEPGAVLDLYRIVRDPGTAESPATDTYAMQFEFAGRRLHCALVDFQARTQTSCLDREAGDTGAGSGDTLLAAASEARAELSPG